jgi:DNA (cytosine-5)-methyltransferase 1
MRGVLGEEGMSELRMLDLFSGIGGFSLAARWLGGFQTVQFVERDPYCQRILRKHWPDVPIHDDICTFKPAPRSADVVVGGFPCQDISAAGKQAGIKEGTRSGLFYELMRVVRLVGPRYIVLENVAAIVNYGMAEVLGELDEAGFDAEWACIRASDLGALHKRERWWLVAYSISNRSKRNLQQEVSWQQSIQRIESLRSTQNLRIGPSISTPRLLRGTDGLPNKLDRLRALGNAVVPQVAMIPLSRVQEIQLNYYGKEMRKSQGPQILHEMLELRRWS